MKVSLVVASGSHAGRAIPLTGPQFLIGRDPQCQLRPASQAISKLHCAVLVRDGKVYVKDYGSTNGTTVNDKLVQDTEVVIEDGTTLRVGPLDFKVKIEKDAAVADGTPLPGSGTAEAAALAVKAVSDAAPKTPTRDATPAPARASAQPAARPAKPGGPPKPAPKDAVKPGTSEVPAMASSESVSDDDHDRIAAMLLGMDDDGNGSVPDGSTVMDIPSPLLGATTEMPKVDDKKKDDKPAKAQTREEMSSAANDLLRKYMRRPK